MRVNFQMDVLFLLVLYSSFESIQKTCIMYMIFSCKYVKIVSLGFQNVRVRSSIHIDQYYRYNYYVILQTGFARIIVFFRVFYKSLLFYCFSYTVRFALQLPQCLKQALYAVWYHLSFEMQMREVFNQSGQMIEHGSQHEKYRCY